MSIIILIEGREAIPVRAIPLLTDWARMSPDQVAAALAGDIEHHWEFSGLTACSIEGGDVRSIPNTWWKNFPCRALKAIADRIEHTQISSETGYQDWRRESLGALPAGAFVWKDEYEPTYYRTVGPRSTIFKIAVDDTQPEDDLPTYVKLQFDPFIPDLKTRHLVMEGFEALINAKHLLTTARGTNATEPAPAGAKPDGRMRIQAEAYELWIRLKASGANPTVHSICGSMAKWCADNNITTHTGVTPRAGTIRNTILGGRSDWQPPKHSRDQAKDHVAQLAQVAQPNPSIDA